MPPTWETGTEQVAYLAELSQRIGGFKLEKERSLISDPRVMDLLFREKVTTIEELIARLRKTTDGVLHQSVVESLAVPDTSFFRDCKVFEALEQKIIPWLVDQPSRTRRLTLWSAGCSTGQEAYSLGIVAHRALEDSFGWVWTVIGTDLSHRNIQIAQRGVYSQYDINSGLPAKRLVEFFVKREGQWRVREELKKQISFRRLNLADSTSPYPEADVVLLRNVTDIFDPQHKANVLAKIHRALRPDGFLVMGEGETVPTSYGFEPVVINHLTFYRPKGAGVLE